MPNEFLDLTGLQKFKENISAVATQNKDGFMSKEDKDRFDNEVANRDEIIGENLIAYPFANTTVTNRNGVDWTDLGNGFVKANGTASTYSDFSLFSKGKIEEGTYTISGVPDGASTSTYVLFLNWYKDNVYSKTTYFTKTTTFTLSASDVSTYTFTLALRVCTGGTANNVIFKPMLERGSNAHEYQPYNLSRKGIIEQIIGENLFPFPYKEMTKTQADVVWSVDEHGIVTPNGTASAASGIYISTNFTLEAGTYTMSGCPKGGSSTTYRLQMANSDWSCNINDFGEGVTFTLTETTTFNTVRMYVSSGVVATGLVFKPMLEKGTVAHSFQPYNRSREGIIEQIVVDNLLIYPYVDTTRTNAGVTFTDLGDGTVRVAGTQTASTNFRCRSRDVNVDKNQLTLSAGTYTVSGCPSSGSLTTYYLQCGYTGANGSWASLGNDYGEGVTFTLTTETTIQLLIIVDDNCPAIDVTFKPMVEVGTVAHPYTQYNLSRQKLREDIDAIGTGGSNVSVTPSLTSGTKVGTITVDGTATDLYAPTNSDTKVTQTVKTDNANYPLLLAPSGQTATTTTTSCFDSGVTLNPSTNTISASRLTTDKVSTSWLAGNQGEAIINSTANAGSYVALDKLNSTNGYFCDSIHQGARYLTYTDKTNVTENKNQCTYTVTLLNESGNTSFPGTVTATTFSGTASQVQGTAVNPTTETWYNPTFCNAGQTSGSKSLYGNNAFSVGFNVGTATTEGRMALVLGNSTASGTAGNQRGCLRLYDKNSYYANIYFGNGTSTASRNIYFPNAEGTLALNTVATTSANGLMSKTDKTKLDNTNMAYGTCNTAKDTAAKVITVSGNTNWKLTAGAMITIKFSATNTAQNPTFNVNGTGAKKVWYNTALITTSNLGWAGVANRPLIYMYDGTQYVYIGQSYAGGDGRASQTNTTTSAEYRLLLSTNANDTTETNGTRKSTNFRANPSTGAFYAKGYTRIDITGQTLDANTLTLEAGSPDIMKYKCKTSGGSNNITNIPKTGNPFILDVELIRWASTTDYISRQIFVSIGDKYVEYIRYCTNGTWDTNWTKRVFTDHTYSVATTSANGLMSSTDKAKLDNTNIAYATCSTAAATAAKVATIDGNSNWTLKKGSEIIVKYTNTNSASSCTLNVNNTGAKSLWYDRAVYTGNSSIVCGYANRYIRYVYDGTNWIWMGSSCDFNTSVVNNLTSTSTTAALSAAQGKGLNDRINKLHVHQYSLIRQSDIGAITTEQKTFTLFNGRKFSDYGTISITIGASATDVRATQEISRPLFTGLESGAEPRTIYLDCFTDNGTVFNQVCIKYVSDTQVKAYLATSGTKTKYLNIYGTKVDDVAF